MHGSFWTEILTDSSMHCYVAIVCVYMHMFKMYGDYLNMWLLHNIKTMQIYKFTYNPVLLLFVHQPDRVSGRFIANIA